MGVHHYKLDLLPRAAFGFPLPKSLTEVEVERGEDFDSGWWAVFPPSQCLLASLRKFLPTDKPWGETEEFVSSNEWTASDIRLWKHEGRVWKIAFRFSPAGDEWGLLQRFVSLAREEMCVLLESNSRVLIEPDESIVRERLTLSQAMRFVQDPRTTIVQAAKEMRDNAEQ